MTVSALERILGRTLVDEKKGSIATLNDLPQEILQEAAVLAAQTRLAAVDYLLFYVEKAELDHAADFVDDVLLGGADPRSWGISDVLFVPEVNPLEALHADMAVVLRPLEGVDGERWWRVEPDRKFWDWSGICGAPGVLLRQANYLWPTNAARLGVEGHALHGEPLEQVHDLVIAMRRWVSSRIQWDLREHDRPNVTSIHDACTALGIRWDALSSDGRKTIGGLVQELSCPNDDARAPGFKGPDEWYA